MYFDFVDLWTIYQRVVSGVIVFYGGLAYVLYIII